jgi:hypothetical protein
MINKKEVIYEEDELLQSVGDAVFKSLNENMKYPKNLILKVKGLGNFIVRNSKLPYFTDEILKTKCDFTDEEANTFANEVLKEEYRKNKIKLPLYRHLEKQYEAYREKRKTIRKLRDDF